MAVTIDQQIADLTQKLDSIKSVEVPRAAASALNKTAQAARTRTVRGIAKSIKVPQKHVRKRVYLGKARSQKLKSRIRTYYRGIALIDLKPTDRGRGGWKTRRGQGVKAGSHVYSDAFVAMGRHSKKHVFRRTGKTSMVDRKGSKSGSYKYHHVEVVRIGLRRHVDVIAPKAAKRELQQNFPKRLRHDLAWRLSKYEVR